MKRLKRGVALYATENPHQYLVGTHKQVIRINSPEEKSFLALLAHGATENETENFIGELSPQQQAAITDLSAALDENQFCEKRQGALALSKRFISSSTDRATKNSRPERDAAFVQLQNRIGAELAQTTWIEGSEDGGIELLSARQDLFIEISGSNRVATILYSLLIASGATQTRFTHSSRGSAVLVGDLDIAVGSFTSSHIGFAFEKQCEVLRRELSLFPLDKESNYLDEFSTPDLRVHCGEIDPEKLSLWMSSGQPFFHIPSPQADSAEIGPCVIPGKTPCLRCVELVKRDQGGLTHRIPFHEEISNEYSLIAAYAVASIAASQILQYCENSSSEITGKVISLDYQTLAQPHVVTVARHPLCGCAF
jgi:hypothetical protein